MHNVHVNMRPMHAPLDPSAVIRQARERSGLSQAAFAAKLGRTQGVVSRYESGAVMPPADVVMQAMHMTHAPPMAAAPEWAEVRAALDALENALAKVGVARARRGARG